MPQFHETGYGKRFFDRQLPEITKAINRLAEALEEANQKDRGEDKKTKEDGKED